MVADVIVVVVVYFLPQKFKLFDFILYFDEKNIL